MIVAVRRLSSQHILGLHHQQKVSLQGLVPRFQDCAVVKVSKYCDFTSTSGGFFFQCTLLIL